MLFETQSFTLFCRSSFPPILCRYKFGDVEFCSETTLPIYLALYLCKYICSVEMLIFLHCILDISVLISTFVDEIASVSSSL